MRNYTSGFNVSPKISDRMSGQYNIRLHNTTGGQIPVASVAKITGQSGEFLTVARPDENSISADKLVIFPQNITGANEYIRVALLPAVPIPVKYTASHGTPAVGDDMGTHEGSWELSKDYTGWRAVRVDTVNSLVWVAPAHMWGLWDNPFRQISANEWFRPDHTADNFDGVEFEVMARVIGDEGEGGFVPLLFDAFGHLIKINGGAPTATPQPTPTPLEPSATPTPTPTPTPTGSPTWPYPTPTGAGCESCEYDFILVNFSVTLGAAATDPCWPEFVETFNGTHILTYNYTSGDYCHYSKSICGYDLGIDLSLNRTTGQINNFNFSCESLSSPCSFRITMPPIPPIVPAVYCGDTGLIHTGIYGDYFSVGFTIVGWGG